MLKDEGIIRSPKAFIYFSKLRKSDAAYVPGEHFIKGNMAYETIIQKLTTTQSEAKNPVELTIPEGTPSQKTFRMKGAGIKKLNSQEKGDMYVNVTVGIPKKLTEKERELVVKLAEEMGDGGAQKTKPKKKGLFK